jgi:hypothetical protein
VGMELYMFLEVDVGVGSIEGRGEGMNPGGS